MSCALCFIAGGLFALIGRVALNLWIASKKGY